MMVVVQDLSIGLQGEFGTHSHEIVERCAFIVGNFASVKSSLIFLARTQYSSYCAVFEQNCICRLRHLRKIAKLCLDVLQNKID